MEPADTHDTASPAAEQDLNALLTEVHALSTRLKQPAGPESDLLAAGRLILGILEAMGPQSVPQIARQRLTSRQNIQVTVNRLAVQGYVGIQSNPAHKRSGLVVLTETGRALAAKARNEEANTLAGVARSLGRLEVTMATEILRKIRQRIGVEQFKTRRAAPAKSGRAAEAKAPAPVTAEESELPINLL